MPIKPPQAELLALLVGFLHRLAPPTRLSMLCQLIEQCDVDVGDLVQRLNTRHRVANDQTIRALARQARKTAQANRDAAMKQAALKALEREQNNAAWERRRQLLARPSKPPKETTE